MTNDELAARNSGGRDRLHDPRLAQRDVDGPVAEGDLVTPPASSSCRNSEKAIAGGAGGRFDEINPDRHAVSASMAATRIRKRGRRKALEAQIHPFREVPPHTGTRRALPRMQLAPSADKLPPVNGQGGRLKDVKKNTPLGIGMC